jgi:PKD repeat protein
MVGLSRTTLLAAVVAATCALALWIASAAYASGPTVRIGQVTGNFYANPNNSGPFDATQLSKPKQFSEKFPLIAFDPAEGAQLTCSPPSGVGPSTRPFTDVIPKAGGKCSTQKAVSGTKEAGSGALSSFEAVFLADVVVSEPGEVTFSFYADDGWILGIGPVVGGSAQPKYVSGSLANAPSTSPSLSYNVVGAFNDPSSPVERDTTVAFPSAGTYPIEVDYTECCGGSLALTLDASGEPLRQQPIPHNTKPPEIPGPQQGKIVTAVPGIWEYNPTSFTYEWELCSATGTECSKINGATTPSYEPTAAQVGRRLLFKETATNISGASAAVPSPVSAPVLPPAPVNMTKPKITGTPQQGQTLTIVPGTWEGSPTKFTYKWLRCNSLGMSCLDISGATKKTYSPVAADIGSTITAEEVAINTGGPSLPAEAEQATPLITAAAPVEQAQPKIAGTAVRGATLVEEHGLWKNEPTSYQYEWLRCESEGTGCVVVPSAIAATYVVAKADVGKVLEVKEFASNPGGSAGPATSKATAVVGEPELLASAGDAVSAIQGTPVTLDGSGSTPAGDIEHYRWEFGDGQSLEGTSATVSHEYAEAGSYTAKLTVSSGASNGTSTATVTISPKAAQAAEVTVEDEAEHPLAGASVVYIAPSGTRTAATTNGSGVATLAGLPDAADTVYAYKSEFQPAAGHITVSGGAGTTTVKLISGSVATSTLTDHPINEEEMIAAGIDPTNAENKQVYDFTVRLAFTSESSETIPSETIPIPLPCHINFAGRFVGNGCGGSFEVHGITSEWHCSLAECSTEVPCQPNTGLLCQVRVVPFTGPGNKPAIEWLIMRGSVSLLKQFTSVTMTVTNLAENLENEPFTFINGKATLQLEPGLSLAPTAEAQKATVNMANIAGESGGSATWVVRGDKPGKYYMTARYEGEVKAFEGSLVKTEGGFLSPLHIWGANAMALKVRADGGSLAEGVPYHVQIGVTDVAEIPLYDVQLAIDETTHEHFIFQPDQRFSEQLGEIKPGQTVYGNVYIAVPDGPSAEPFNPGLSSAKFAGETETPGPGIEEVKAPVPYAARATDEVSGFVHLHWEPAPGAKGYEVFPTPSLDTPFAAEPTAVKLSPSESGTMTEVPPSATDAYVPVSGGEVADFWAVSTVGEGLTLNHPVVRATTLVAAQLGAPVPECRGYEGLPSTKTLPDGTEAPLPTTKLTTHVNPRTHINEFWDAEHERPFHLHSVNWYGAEQQQMVPDGLQNQTLSALVHAMKQAGFNSVRLPFSNEMVELSALGQKVCPETVAANPTLVNDTPMQVLGAAIHEMTRQGILVILDDHTTEANWSGVGGVANGLWRDPKDGFTTKDWESDWRTVVGEFGGIPGVVGVDLRNEIRENNHGEKEGWSYSEAEELGGNVLNWRHAASEAAGQVLSLDKSLLVFVTGLETAKDLLQAGPEPVLPITPTAGWGDGEAYSSPQVAYEQHDYEFFGYTGKTAAEDKKDIELKLQQATLHGRAVWLGEFGTCNSASSCITSKTVSSGVWFSALMQVLREHPEVGWAYWAFNGTYSTNTEGKGYWGKAEPYGVMNATWDGFAMGNQLVNALPALRVKTLKPTKSSAAGGPVTIGGEELEEATGVTFGGVPATIVNSSSNSPISLAVIAPPHVAGKVPVTVATPEGASPENTKLRYIYEPVVETISPTEGTIAGGTLVTVKGIGFEPSKGDVFRLGSANATAVECTTTTTCTFLTPRHPAGTIEGRATVNGITSTKAVFHFTYK